MNRTIFSDEIIEAARRHARAEFPKESCGLVIDGVYKPCKNVADDPENDFKISAQEQIRLIGSGKLQGVIHSHPNGPLFPSRSDMIGQINTGVAWVILPTFNGEDFGHPICWGGNQPVEPLIGRQFNHGVADCYSLVRDVYRLGKEGCAAQDVDWPLDPIELPEVPRDDCWWDLGEDLYSDHIAKFGFKPINFSEAQPGDAFLIKIRSEKLNHAGVLLNGGLILQHLVGRLSRREPAGLWARQADLWVRYVGVGNA